MGFCSKGGVGKGMRKEDEGTVRQNNSDKIQALVLKVGVVMARGRGLKKQVVRRLRVCRTSRRYRGKGDTGGREKRY